jgi:putative membrane protein
MNGDFTMWQRLSAFLFLCFVIATPPMQAIAQQAQQQPAPQPFPWYGPGPWHMWDAAYGWQFWWICPLMMLFMLVVIGGIFFFARRPSGGSPHHWEPQWRGPSHSALQILNERFARGEIQKAEYEDKKAAILAAGQH